MNAGDFRWQINVLEFVKAGQNAYEWQPVNSIWAKKEHQNVRVVYSKVGVTARSVKFMVYSRHILTLHNALSASKPATEHYFLTDINRDMPGFSVVTAAIVEPVNCLLQLTKTLKGAGNRPVIEKLEPLSFPGYLTEKYLRQDQKTPMSHSEIRYVLITPKAIDIPTGELIEIGGALYASVIPHTLDPYKNEYEILRRMDN